MKSCLFCFVVIFVVSPAQAQIYDCEGLWTNKSCDGVVRNTLTEQPVRERPKEVVQLDMRKMLIHDLNVLRLKARREHGVTVNIGGVEEICLDLSVSLSECNAAITTKEELINNGVLAQQKLELEKEKGESKTEQNTTIIQVREGNRRWLHGEHGLLPPAPKPRPPKPRDEENVSSDPRTPSTPLPRVVSAVKGFSSSSGGALDTGTQHRPKRRR